jgi:hypothetical protein
VSYAAAALLGVWLVLAPMAACADGDSPHHMTTSDGSLDMTTCAVCHNEDFSLQRSKLETCTLCHAQTSHAGSDEHLRVSPSAVKNALGETPQGGAVLPLADDGHIYCGTCHLFHDPKVTSEGWLAHGWLPPTSGLPAAVRQAVTERWAALVASSEDKGTVGKFATKGTTQMRLPVDDGQLCRRCHGALR